ncbi:MAG: hypothetical protein ACK5X3_19745, partial [Pseudomonadota bacterium]
MASRRLFDGAQAELGLLPIVGEPATGAITGSVSATLDGISLSATGSLNLAGSVSIALDDASAASSATLRLAGSVSPGLDGMTLTAGATLAGGGSLIALNSRLVYLGDSLIASGPMRSARQLGQVY